MKLFSIWLPANHRFMVNLLNNRKQNWSEKHSMALLSYFITEGKIKQNIKLKKKRFIVENQLRHLFPLI